MNVNYLKTIKLKKAKSGIVVRFPSTARLCEVFMKEEKLESCIRKLNRRTPLDGHQLIFGWLKQGMIENFEEYLILVTKQQEKQRDGIELPHNDYNGLYRMRHILGLVT